MTYVLLMVGGPAHGQLREVVDLHDIEVVEQTDKPLAFIVEETKITEPMPRGRIHYYRPTELSSEDRDGTQWKARIALHGSYQNASELLKLQAALGAMLRLLPHVQEVRSDTWGR